MTRQSPERRPTEKQADLLAAIDAREVHRDPAGKDRWLRFADQAGANVSVDVRRLRANGWVEETDGPTGLALTWAGRRDLGTVRALAAWDALPYTDPVKQTVRITPRPLGGKTCGRGGSAGTGRNLRCSICYREQEARGLRTADSIVWSTNEGGYRAQRDAEEARAIHVVGHHTPGVDLLDRHARCGFCSAHVVLVEGGYTCPLCGAVRAPAGATP